MIGSDRMHLISIQPRAHIDVTCSRCCISYDDHELQVAAVPAPVLVITSGWEGCQLQRELRWPSAIELMTMMMRTTRSSLHCQSATGGSAVWPQ